MDGVKGRKGRCFFLSISRDIYKFHLTFLDMIENEKWTEHDPLI